MKKGHGSKFDRKKEAAIQALFSERNQTEAARVAGIDPSTLRRWQRLPEFQVEYLQVRRDLMSQASGRLQYHAGTLISVGLKLIGDSATPSSVRASLILGFIDRANKAVESEDVLVRLEALERSLAEQKDKR
jgi:hypothetical protein